MIFAYIACPLLEVKIPLTTLMFLDLFRYYLRYRELLLLLIQCPIIAPAIGSIDVSIIRMPRLQTFVTKIGELEGDFLWLALPYFCYVLIAVSLKPELFEGLRFDFTKGLNQKFSLSHR